MQHSFTIVQTTYARTVINLCSLHEIMSDYNIYDCFCRCSSSDECIRRLYCTNKTAPVNIVQIVPLKVTDAAVNLVFRA